jgi:hypothetical protein
MPKHKWSCLVCEASNVASDSTCRLCGAPLQLSAKEIESLRATWELAENDKTSVDISLGPPSKLALFTVAYMAVLWALSGLALSSAANPIAVGMLLTPLFIPVPILVLAWIVAVMNSLLKSKSGK